MTRSMATVMLALVATANAAADGLDSWPPRSYLVKSLVQGIPGILNAYNAETGRFGAEPWICCDQNRMFPLAAAWSIEHTDNPYYRSEEVLAAIGGGGVALVEAQDEAGRWRFDKKDGSYWGQTHMPWTYSRWIRAYHLVGHALPEDVRATWETGLKLGYERLAALYPGRSVHNIPVHHAMGLYIAGVAFDNADWRQRAREFMPKVVEAQDPTGFWSEHQGPVVAYNYVYSDSLGIYYHFAKDPLVLEALERAARFHASILWPDGTSVSCIDERNLYSRNVRIGNPGFSHTPEGRGYLLVQLRHRAGDALRSIDADMAAALLLYGGQGEVVMPEQIGEDGVVILGDGDALMRRDDGWSWALSAYTAEVPNNRWIQDRHNLVDLFHAELGLVAGGGNTKLQPRWSTFTLGETSLLSHTPGDESPNFTPDIDMVWTPERAKVGRNGARTRLEATLVRRAQFNRETLLSEDFEAPAAGELPDTWSIFSRAGTMEVTATQAHGGEKSLRFLNDDDKRSLGLRSPQLPAEPGELYFAEACWLAEPDNNATVYLEFWNARQERIAGGVRTFVCKGQGQWAAGGGSARAPEDTVAVTMLVYSGTTATADGFFDDLVLGRLVPDERSDNSVECSLEVRTEDKDVVLIYRGRQGAGASAHLPLLPRGSRLELANGETIPLLDAPVELTSQQLGQHFVHSNLRVSVPDGASLHWPARHYNPYTRDGRSGLNNAKIVLAMPFEQTGEYVVRLSAMEQEPFQGLVFEARDLSFEHSEGTYTRRLDEFSSKFIGRGKPGDWLRFTLPASEPGRYELFGDFVLAPSYAIVEVLVDDRRVGKPFDGYWGGVDALGTMQSFGEIRLGKEQHTVTVRIIGQNPKSNNHFFSVKRWLLKPLD